jgi:hypothetical protein
LIPRIVTIHSAHSESSLRVWRGFIANAEIGNPEMNCIEAYVRAAV